MQKRRNTMNNKHIYVRPDPNLPKDEAINEVVDALMNFFADQLESEGKHEDAERFREKIADRTPPDEKAANTSA
jgi:hypothetical protein